MVHATAHRPAWLTLQHASSVLLHESRVRLLAVPKTNLVYNVDGGNTIIAGSHHKVY